MSPETSTLKTFRNKLFELFPKRRDATMNLLDALSANGHQCRSVVLLSETPQFERQYSSITDAIADGLSHAEWNLIEKMVYQTATHDHTQKTNKFLLDCTANPRPFARTLEDRTVTHAPNPAPGNKPITVGHQYSTLALLPKDEADRKKHWLVPLSTQRVNSFEKGNEVGMKHLVQYLREHELTDQLNICMADSLYSSKKCRAILSSESSVVGVLRLNSARNVYFAPNTESSPRGRHKEYGEKMKLNDLSSHQPCQEKTQTQWTNRKGNAYIVSIECWNDMLIRGTRDYHAAKHPFRLIRITVKNQKNEIVFKKPLWLAVTGKRRNEISLIDAYQDYRARYDIEHFFRFCKQKLLMRSYQTANVDHEVSWWKFCALAYCQLYLARKQVTMTLHRWEEYLPQYKGIDQKQPSLATPSQTQRGFEKLLEQIGTPANDCIARGRASGRTLGQKQKKRSKQEIVFKSSSPPKNTDPPILLGSEKTANDSDTQTIESLLLSVHKQLNDIDLSPSEFAKRLLNTE